MLGVTPENPRLVLPSAIKMDFFLTTPLDLRVSSIAFNVSERFPSLFPFNDQRTNPGHACNLYFYSHWYGYRQLYAKRHYLSANLLRFKLANPSIFLAVGLILCAVMSVATGTSWGTVGTMGVVLMGIGAAMNIPLPIVAGMVICGATFGDKMSPVSDTTNLASMSAGTNLY